MNKHKLHRPLALTALIGSSLVFVAQALAKPALTRTVYDSIKWASAVGGLLQEAV